MKTVVVRNIKRTDADLVKRLGALGVATAHEAYGRFGLMKPYLRPVWSGAETSGTAVTVLAQPGDNWMIHVAVEQCQPGAGSSSMPAFATPNRCVKWALRCGRRRSRPRAR